MRRRVADSFRQFSRRLEPFRNLPRAEEDDGPRLLGTSGTVTTLASVHLGLEQYDRQAVDGLIETLLNSESREDFVAATRALDRVLTAGRYVIPIYQWNISRIAHAAELKYPEELPIYGDWIGWQPDVWWYEED